MENHKANRLISEKSPYLQQHAYNPVDWYPWGPEALELAKKEDKPILVSIGYATCHWCHVMERESFENEDVAAIMNEYFVCIKVDREERPDLDQIYMEACQMMNGSGGWPLNCFLTPDLNPFFAGTYFPPQAAYGKVSWPQLLQNLNQAYKKKRADVFKQAARLAEYVKNGDARLLGESDLLGDFPTKVIATTIESKFDSAYGGFGAAPKFPMFQLLHFVFNLYRETKKVAHLDFLKQTTERLIYGGIYDQVGGGLSRYATDNDWNIPHFEKMLYDNAQLLTWLSVMYEETENEVYKTYIYKTVTFLKREMESPTGGYYSGIDADSEGVEGKFYTWNYEEFSTLLGEKATEMIKYYSLEEDGNWEGVNILWVDPNIKPSTELIKESNEVLLNHRSKRIRPITDQKIIISWNALLASGYCAAYKALNDDKMLENAKEIMVFIDENCWKDGVLKHLYNEEVSDVTAFADGYTHLAKANLDLFDVTQEAKYYKKALALFEQAVLLFGDSDAPTLFFSIDNDTELISRKKEFYDSVTPSSNSTFLSLLRRLSNLQVDVDLRLRGEKILKQLQESIEKYPSSFGNFASEWIEYGKTPLEVVLVGDSKKYFQELQENLIFQESIYILNDETKQVPLIAEKVSAGKDGIYVCAGLSCFAPVQTVEEALTLLNEHR